MIARASLLKSPTFFRQTVWTIGAKIRRSGTGRCAPRPLPPPSPQGRGGLPGGAPPMVSGGLASDSAIRCAAMSTHNCTARVKLRVTISCLSRSVASNSSESRSGHLSSIRLTHRRSASSFSSIKRLSSCASVARECGADRAPSRPGQVAFFRSTSSATTSISRAFSSDPSGLSAATARSTSLPKPSVPLASEPNSMASLIPECRARSLFNCCLS